MVVLFREVLDDLREFGVAYVGVITGEDNEHLHRRDLVVRVVPIEGTDTEEVRSSLDGVEQVMWQGEEWGFEYGIAPESVAGGKRVSDVYIRGDGVELEPLFEAWRETWMAELSEIPLEELEENKRWQYRARELRKKTGRELSPRTCQVIALDEIGRSTEDIMELFNITENSVEKRRKRPEERGWEGIGLG